MKYTTSSGKETAAVATAFEKTLNGGEVIGLVGDLGVGKTVFVKALAKALGVTSAVSSPTFVVMKIYKTKHKTIKQLVHIDAYRLRDGESLRAIGADDYFGVNDTIVAIEWANRVSGILPKNHRKVFFSHISSDSRSITID